jgi:hypothetical protein
MEIVGHAPAAIREHRDQGRGSLDFFFGHTVRMLILFAVTVIPYLILRMGSGRRLSA